MLYELKLVLLYPLPQSSQTFQGADTTIPVGLIKIAIVDRKLNHLKIYVFLKWNSLKDVTAQQNPRSVIFVRK